MVHRVGNVQVVGVVECDAGRSIELAVAIAELPPVRLELAEPVSVADVRSALADQLPQLVPLARGLLIAVGTDYADDTVTLDAGDTIACFPPVSGG